MLSDRCLPVLFVTLVYCGQTAGWIKMPLGTEVGLGRGDIVLHGDPAPLPKKEHSSLPLFCPCHIHVYCGQTAEWIKMPLGMEVGLGPGDIVLGGDPATLPKKGTAAPTFRPISIVAKRLYGSRCHLVYGDRLRRRPHCVGDPDLPQNGAQTHFSAHVYCGRTDGCHLAQR